MYSAYIHNMVICFDATTEAKRALDALLQTGQFRNTSEVVSLALANYEVLQRSTSTGDSCAVAGGPEMRTENSRLGPQRAAAPRTSKPAPSQPQIPEVCFLNSTTAEGVKLASVPAANVGAATSLPPAQWLFGQYNKFLPVKASCRALLNLLRERPGAVPLSEAVETISQAAWELGDYLYTLDQRAGRSREEFFAAAFPTTVSNGPVSRIRFGNQFVGNLRQPKQAEGQPKETKFTGFPAALRFMVCNGGKSPSLQLTTAGAEFALLRNPILDSTQEQADRKFSEAEIAFLLSHMKSFVPEETSAYYAILDAIQSGANTPDAVDAYLRHRFNLSTEQDMTKTFLTTQRTGAISRLADLALIAREKQGLRVTYLLTSKGSDLRSHLTKKD
jgi:hypothetical protein